MATSPRSTDDSRNPLPARPSPQRVSEAGMSGGEAPRHDPQRDARRSRVTADDAAPQTLIDEGGGSDPAEPRPRAADAQLSVVDASAAGLGGGTDEAEDAVNDPIDPQELARIRARVARSGGPVTNLEPNESRAGNPGRRKNRRK